MKRPDVPLWPAGTAPLPAALGEKSREAVLAAYDFDSLEDDLELAAIVKFAAALCEARTSLVSLVESERQRFLVREGLEERETPRQYSFCAYAMMDGAVMEVPDATQDERFADNPLVCGPPNIRFYAGAPLVSEDGVALGALCIIDDRPRPQGLTVFQREGLTVLATAVGRRLRSHRYWRSSRAQIERSEAGCQLLLDSLPDVAWSAEPDGEIDYLNERFETFTGAKQDQVRADWLSLIHPDDRGKMKAAWEDASVQRKSLEADCRYRSADGDWRWVLIRAMPLKTSDGEIQKWFGTITDIDKTHRESDRRDLLARELSHRIKNIFAVIAGLVSLSTLKRPELREFGDELIGTIRALGRAHDFVRPVDGAKGEKLHGLLDELCAPYRAGNGHRVRIDGQDVAIGPRAATPLALIFHELATNSAKYGALSIPEGHIELTIACTDEIVTIRWIEKGGPPPPEKVAEGFGSRLVEMSVSQQLRGILERRWKSDGLQANLTIPLEALRT